MFHLSENLTKIAQSMTNKIEPKTRTIHELDVRMALTQKKAKVLVRDYLRETGRKGTTELVKAIHRETRRNVFSQRTLEKWLQEQKRMLNAHNWEIMSAFIDTTHFKGFVPYANEGSADKRLIQVADGFLALYGETKKPRGIYVLPSTINAEGIKAVIELSGNWENAPNLPSEDLPRTICKIEHVEGKRYAKFAYIALFRSKQISATGIAMYLASSDIEACNYYHHFALQLWRRRDPESSSTMPVELIWSENKPFKPELSVSKALNQYFYKEDHEALNHTERISIATEDQTVETQLSFSSRFFMGLDQAIGNTISLKRNLSPISDELLIIEQLLEDVLPHGYAEA